jgi:hypothetical protein
LGLSPAGSLRLSFARCGHKRDQFGDKDLKHSFKIKKYSNENLMEAMKSKAPVEIMN